MVAPVAIPLIAAGVGAAAHIGGGLLTNTAAKREAERNRAFQEEMSSTAFQRARADMEAAGLNPALMYGSGGPSSTPSGGQAPIENFIDEAGDQAISSAFEARRLEKELDQLDSQKKLNDSLSKKAEAEGAAAEGYSAIPRKIGEVIDALPSMKPRTRGILDKLSDFWRNSPRYADEMLHRRD